MAILISLIVSIFLTMVLIPPLIKIAGNFRLLDNPNERKIHCTPIPRVGGIAIFIGSVAAIVITISWDLQLLYIFFGAATIAVFGVLDDRFDLHFQWKLLGQIVAATIVFAGGISVERLPFIGTELSPLWSSLPLTVLFVLLVTNAFNFSDGLDGLAGGCAMLSLGGIGVLGYAADNVFVTVVATVLIGSILGFLRFNTYPAMIYMGDSGSQFIGFIIAVLSLYLVTDANSALNPILPIFLAGVPLLDTVIVILLRLKNRASPFRADNRHLHHRLLRLQFFHHETVAIIYGAQGLFVGLAFFMRYQSDLLAVLALAGLYAAVIILMFLSENFHWNARAARSSIVPPREVGGAQIERRNLWLRKIEGLPTSTAYAVQFGVIFLFFAGAATTPPVSVDVAILSFVYAAMMMFAHFFLNAWTGLFTRLGMLCLCILIMYLWTDLVITNSNSELALNLYLFALCVVLAAAIRLTRRDSFQMTPQDFLMLIFIVTAPNLPIVMQHEASLGVVVVRVAVVVYCCEFVISRNKPSYLPLRLTTFVCLLVIGTRSFMA